MQKLFFIIFYLSYLSSGFSSNNPLHPMASEISSSPKPHLDTSLSPNTYSYFTIGSGMLIQQVGVGQRYKNLENCKGSDLSFNVHFSIPMTLDKPGRYRHQVFPSLKYTYLNYRDNSPAPHYFGVSYEAILMFPDGNNFSYFFPIPNIGLIWGKERESVRFSQLQLNVFPAIGCILGTGMLLSSNAFDNQMMGFILAWSGSATLFSYNVAF